MSKVLELVALLAICLSCVCSLDICEDQIDGAQILHPTDCTKYVVCRLGETSAVEKCEEGKHFNRLTAQCDEPTKAACDVAVIKNLLVASDECNSCSLACGCIPESECVTPGPATPAPATPAPATPAPATPAPATPAPATPAPATPAPATPAPATPAPATPAPATPAPATPAPATPAPATPAPATPAPATPAPATPAPAPATPAPATPIPSSGAPTSCSNDLEICVGQPDYSSVYVNGTCSQYAICILECANVLSCPNNLLYDIASHSCTYPQNVNCPYPHPAPTGPSAGPSGTTCEQHGKCENQPDGAQFPDDASNGYIVCQCECEIVRPCPGGLVFNDSLKVCDFPAANK